MAYLEHAVIFWCCRKSEKSPKYSCHPTQALDVFCADYFIRRPYKKYKPSYLYFKNCNILVIQLFLLTASFSSSSFSLCHSASSSVGSAAPVMKSLLCERWTKIGHMLDDTKVIKCQHKNQNTLVISVCSSSSATVLIYSEVSRPFFPSVTS